MEFVTKMLIKILFYNIFIHFRSKYVTLGICKFKIVYIKHHKYS